jgi:subtilisin family serine protease
MRGTVWALIIAAVAALVGITGRAQQRSVSAPVIVVFRADARLDGFENQYESDIRAQRDPDGWSYLNRGVTGAVQALERAHGFQADHVYSAALRGFAARLSQDQIAALQRNPLVSYIEADLPMHTIAQTIPWGISQIGADVSSTVAGDGMGAVTGVRAYIIDTGIDWTHDDLHVVWHVNFTGLFGGGNIDCNGHGTHVSGTVGAIDNTSDVVGVAPAVPLVGVKVLNCQGAGLTSTVIKGVDWVTQNAILPAVANMSLGGSASLALDTSVRNSAASGVTYAVAAGNDGADACNSSPSRAGLGTNGILTVAATDQNDQEASFSNFGNCVDVWAPGVGVLSTWPGGGTQTLSGTSMATPHVTGTAALFLSGNPSAGPVDVERAIKLFAQSVGTVSKDGRSIMRLWAGNF